MITPDQNRLIHHAKRRLEMTDADYRGLLQRAAGVDSSKKLDDAGVDAVMREFGRLGFKIVQQAPAYGVRLGMATPAQLSKVRSLWRKYAGTEEETGLEHFLERHFKVSSLRFLDACTVAKVIVTLEKMAERRKSHPRPRKKASRRNE